MSVLYISWDTQPKHYLFMAGTVSVVFIMGAPPTFLKIPLFPFTQLTLVVTAVSFLYVLPVVDMIADASDEVERAVMIISSSPDNINISQAILNAYSIAFDTVYAASGKESQSPFLLGLLCL